MIELTLEQIMVLFLFAMSGYILGKKGIVCSEQAGILSKLEVYIFLPCMTFKTFSTEFTISSIKEKYPLILLSVVILLLVCLFAVFLAKGFSKECYEQKVYTYSLIIPNFGYMGYALMEALFGSEMLLNMMIFALPVTAFTYTVGFCMLTNERVTAKRLLQPTVIAIGLGALTGLTGLRLPEAVSVGVAKGAACVAPVSMILTGITLSTFSLKELLKEKRYYIVSIFRLIVIPCTIALALKLFGGKEEMLVALVLYAMPCGLNTIVFPKLVGEDCKIGAGLACISNVLACVTIPLCVWLFTL